MQNQTYGALFILVLTVIAMSVLQPINLIANTGNGSQNGENSIIEIVNYYLEITEALAADDARIASVHGQHLQDAINNSVLDHEDWDTQQQSLIRYTNRITGSSNLNTQRIALNGLTRTMIETLHSIETYEIELYLQYCSMALQDGGQWLSPSEDIANPYYGSSMLACGENIEIIR